MTDSQKTARTRRSPFTRAVIGVILPPTEGRRENLTAQSPRPTLAVRPFVVRSSARHWLAKDDSEKAKRKKRRNQQPEAGLADFSASREGREATFPAYPRTRSLTGKRVRGNRRNQQRRQQEETRRLKGASVSTSLAAGASIGGETNTPPGRVTANSATAPMPLLP